MKLSKLKSGMLVQMREGVVFMNIKGTLVSRGQHQGIKNYNSDLTHPTYRSMDIVKVSEVLSENLLRPEEWTIENLDNFLQWEENDFTFEKGDYIGYTEDGETVEFIVLVTDASGSRDGVFSAVITETMISRMSGVGYYCESWDKKLVNGFKWIAI